MISYSIFLIDDEETIRSGVSFSLKKEYRIKTFADAETAMTALDSEVPDLIILDIMLPGISGVDALSRIKKKHPEVLVIMISALEDFTTVMSAMKGGAHDYIVKPIHMDSMRVVIKKALDTIKMRKEIQLLQSRHLQENIPCFVGESNQIQDVMQTVDIISQSPDTPVLILGESGTGKDLIARAIHYKSPNFAGEMVSLNCAAIPRSLLESELFGYESGAFSGSDKKGKKGLVEVAENGTLFLDEIGDLCMEAQAKLLRFLEAGEFYRIGGTRKLTIQTRIIAATNKDLLELISAGEFRQDLYYRLAVITISVPSLNRRRADIIPIAKHFLGEFGKTKKKNFTGICPRAQEFLTRHDWKGNIRELKNVIERGSIISQGPLLTLEDLGFEKGPQVQKYKQGAFPPLPEEGINLTEMEAHYINEALQRTGGNETRAARLLNMTYYAFRYRRKKIAQDQEKNPK